MNNIGKIVCIIYTICKLFSYSYTIYTLILFKKANGVRFFHFKSFDKNQYLKFLNFSLNNKD